MCYSRFGVRGSEIRVCRINGLQGQAQGFEVQTLGA